MARGQRGNKNAPRLEFPLLEPGLKVVGIKGDGNCLFRALADQLRGTTGEHASIRAAVVAHLRANAAYFQPFVPQNAYRRNAPRRSRARAAGPSAVEAVAPSATDLDVAFDNYVAAIEKGGTWGDQVEIVAFARCYGVAVHVYMVDRVEVMTPPAEAMNTTTRAPLRIAYHAWEHYSSVHGTLSTAAAAIEAPTVTTTPPTSSASQGTAATPSTPDTTPSPLSRKRARSACDGEEAGQAKEDSDDDDDDDRPILRKRQRTAAPVDPPRCSPQPEADERTVSTGGAARQGPRRRLMSRTAILAKAKDRREEKQTTKKGSCGRARDAQPSTVRKPRRVKTKNIRKTDHA